MDNTKDIDKEIDNKDKQQHVINKPPQPVSQLPPQPAKRGCPCGR